MKDVSEKSIFWVLLIFKLLLVPFYRGIQSDSLAVFLFDEWLSGKWMPLYGSLVLVISKLSVDPEWIAKGMSALASAALIFPLTSLSRQLWGKGFVLWNGIVILIHPLLLRYGLCALNDMVFCFLFLQAFAKLRDPSFIIWFWLAALTRPEGLVLLPVALLHSFYCREYRWVFWSGACLFSLWAFLRPAVLALQGIEEASWTLWHELVSGLFRGPEVWLWHLLATGFLWLLLSFPVFIKFSWISEIQRSSLGMLFIFSAISLLVITSATPHWSGRRALPLVVLCLPFIVKVLFSEPRRGMFACVIFLSMSLFSLPQFFNEYRGFREACLWVKQSGFTGPLVSNDVKRARWWLGRECQSFDVVGWQSGSRLILSSRFPNFQKIDEMNEQPLFDTTESWRNIFGDTFWLRDERPLCHTPPRFEEWFRMSFFEVKVY